MTSFEDELVDLLDARAERVSVRNDGAATVGEAVVLLETASSSDVIVPIGERRSDAVRRRSPKQGLLGAAAAIVIVLGVFSLTRSSGDSVTELDTAGLPDAASDFFADLLDGPVEFVVWLEPDASQAQVDGVREVLAGSDLAAVRYVDSEATFAEFQEFWSDSPEILAAVEPEQLPTSFRALVSSTSDEAPVADLIRLLMELDGVRDVAFDVEFAELEGELVVELGPPLFVLPGSEYLTSTIEGQAPSSDDVPAMESMVIGRRTDLGFTDMVVVEWVAERGFLATAPIEIDGRVVEPFIDQDGLVAERLPDGTWLRFTSWRDPDLLEAVVPTVALVDGQIVVTANDDNASAGFELLTSAVPGPHAGTVTSVIGDEGLEMLITIAAVDGEGAELFAIAANDADAERFSNNELDGYYLRPTRSTSLGDFNGFSWRIGPGHVATLLLPGSDEDVLAAVASVRKVDEATWQAALDGDLPMIDAPTDPLFLLPSNDALLEGLQGFVSELDDWSANVESPGLAVGRPTPNGFDQLMAVAMLDEREFHNGEVRVIDERQISVDQGVEAIAAEPLADGRWLHFYVNDLDADLTALVEATSVVDGEIFFEPYDEIVEVSRVGGLAPTGRTVAISPEVNADGGFSLSTSPRSEDLALISFAVSFESVTAIEVRGQPGYQATSADASKPGDAIAWFEPSGHLVVLFVAAPDSAVDRAESLMIVDEATWRAAVAELEVD